MRAGGIKKFALNHVMTESRNYKFVLYFATILAGSSSLTRIITVRGGFNFNQIIFSEMGKLSTFNISRSGSRLLGKTYFAENACLCITFTSRILYHIIELMLSDLGKSTGFGIIAQRAMILDFAGLAAVRGNNNSTLVKYMLDTRYHILDFVAVRVRALILTNSLISAGGCLQNFRNYHIMSIFGINSNLLSSRTLLTAMLADFSVFIALSSVASVQLVLGLIVVIAQLFADGFNEILIAALSANLYDRFRRLTIRLADECLAVGVGELG